MRRAAWRSLGSERIEGAVVSQGLAEAGKLRKRVLRMDRFNAIDRKGRGAMRPHLANDRGQAYLNAVGSADFLLATLMLKLSNSGSRRAASWQVWPLPVKDAGSDLRPLSAAERFGVLPRPELRYTPAVARETAELYEKVKHHIPQIEWPVYAPYIHAINRLKRNAGAVVLAHNYQTPDIFHCVADIVGDSLQLAREATRSMPRSSSSAVCISWRRRRSS
jgi:hypothetical protein